MAGIKGSELGLGLSGGEHLDPQFIVGDSTQIAVGTLLGKVKALQGYI